MQGIMHPFYREELVARNWDEGEGCSIDPLWAENVKRKGIGNLAESSSTGSVQA